MKEIPTVEQFKEWMKDAFYNRPKEGSGRMMIVGKSAWMGVVKDAYQLTEEEAIEKYNEAKSKETDRLLHEFDPKTGFKKDIVRIYLIGEYK